MIVPCYNAAETIADTIASVQAQTVRTWELVVVDDGSTDTSASVVEALAAADDRITLIRQPNSGVSTARNAGIEATTAPLIGLVDADDLWKPDFIASMTEEFDGDPELGVAYCRAEILDGEGVPTGTTMSFEAPEATVDELLLTNPAGTCSTLMIRRTVFEDVGQFSTELRRVEDQHWMLKARLGGWTLRGVPKTLVGYRTSEDGLSADLDGMLDGWEAMIELLGDSVDPAKVSAARAEHCFYLARRAVRLGRPVGTIANYLRQSVASDPSVSFRKLAKIPSAVFGGRDRVELATGETVGDIVALPARPADEQPLVSVVMPIYGAEQFVGAAVQSVLDQTYTNFELLLVNDGTKDRSIEICETFGDPRITIIHQANRGLPGARNTGIRQAKGDLIGLIDADDIWLPTKLAAHVDHFARRPHVSVSYSASRLVDEHGDPIGVVQMPKLRDVTIRDVICRNPIGNGSAPVIRREVFDAIAYTDDRHGELEDHYFDEDFRYAEDVECWTRIAATTDAVFEGIGEELTDYRVISGSLSAGTKDHYSYWLRHYGKVKEYAPRVAAEHGEAARGYQIRFYARRDLQGGDAMSGLKWFGEAMRAHPKMVVEEPAKTVVTFGALIAGLVLPDKVFNRLMERVLSTGAATPKPKLVHSRGTSTDHDQRKAA